MARRPDPTKLTGAKTRIKLEPHQVVLRPLVTEKSMHRSELYNQYTFEVSTLATKKDIKHAVEDLFEVRVEKIRTQNRTGKSRRYRFRRGKTKAWKKALVTLNAEDRINFF